MKKNPLVESKWPPLDAHQWWTCPIIYQVHNRVVVKLNSGKSRVYNNIGLVVKQVNVRRVFIVTKQFFSLFELDRMLSDTPSTWNGCAAASCKLFVFLWRTTPVDVTEKFSFSSSAAICNSNFGARARGTFFSKTSNVSRSFLSFSTIHWLGTDHVTPFQPMERVLWLKLRTKHGRVFQLMFQKRRFCWTQNKKNESSRRRARTCRFWSALTCQ